VLRSLGQLKLKSTFVKTARHQRRPVMKTFPIIAMFCFKRYVRPTGFIATLAAGLVLSVAIDGAGAKDQAREGSGAVSSSARAERPSILAEKPVETGSKPFRNTIHPIIVKPDDRDKHHGRKHDHDHENDHGHQAVCECLYPPCPVTCGPQRSKPAKPAPAKTSLLKSLFGKK